MADVRGKFTVTRVSNYSATSTNVGVELEAKYSNSPEDNSYSAATPQGKITMMVTSPSAVEKLLIGGVFYVDFTPVDKEKA